MLALRADQDGHLRQKLQHVLKLSKEKWDEARDHAMRAVVADNRMRAWYADRRSCELGVLFTARLGNVDLERPVGALGSVPRGWLKTAAQITRLEGHELQSAYHHSSSCLLSDVRVLQHLQCCCPTSHARGVRPPGPAALLQTKLEAGERKTEAILVAQLSPAQRDTLRHMQPQAVAAWWAPGHPGWAIFPMDSDAFLQVRGAEWAHHATTGEGAEVQAGSLVIGVQMAS